MATIKSAIIALIFAVTLLPVTALSNNSTTYLDLSSIGSMPLNGSYRIEILKGGEWLEVAVIECDKFFREKQIDLSDIAPAGKSIKIRITQEGGGESHIDAILYGGNAPTKAIGADNPLTLKKLSRMDNDVIPAKAKTIELTFRGGKNKRILSFIGRVEAEKIPEIPLFYPRENPYEPLTSDSKFYSYRLDSNRGRLAIDGKLKEVAGKKPFVKKYSVPTSGHPAGLNYFWVSNDDDNLYVSVDFTSDNTFDGNVDYAKVHIKTDDGVKEYKVSMAETAWGKPGFIYTDKVAYQHKVYEFKIPLKELSIVEVSQEMEIPIAFSVYGTSAGGHGYPDIVYDANNNQFFMAYMNFNNMLISGRLLNPDGATLLYFDISTLDVFGIAAPKVAHDPINHRFLVTWWQKQGLYSVLLGKFVNEDGTLFDRNGNGSTSISDDDFLIASNVSISNVAFDSEHERYLVVWSSANGIIGQWVGPEGNLIGDTFFVYNAPGGQHIPNIAYDSVNHRFLVSFVNDTDGAGEYRVYGQFVHAVNGLVHRNGAPGSDIFPISDRRTSIWRKFTHLTFDRANGNFLASWVDTESADDIYGQLVDRNGQLITTSGAPGADNFAISDNAANQSIIGASFDPVNQLYLVAWEDYRNSVPLNETDVYGQFLNADGTLNGTTSSDNFPVVQSPHSNMWPVVAANTNCGGYFVAYSVADIQSVLGVTKVTAPVMDGPGISVNPNAIDFGNVQAGDSLTQVVNVTSFCGTINITGIADSDTLDAPYSIENDNCSGNTIDPTGGCSFTVRFSPAGHGLFNDTFNITSNDADEPVFTVKVSGSVNSPPSKPVLLLPQNGQTGVEIPIFFAWQRSTDPDGDPVTYDLYFCENGYFNGCSPTQTASASADIDGASYAWAGGLGASLLMFGIVFASNSRRRKRLIGIFLVLAISAGLIYGCAKGGDDDPFPNIERYFSAGALPGTIYYWKVVAKDGLGGETESDVWSFTTK